MRLVVTGREGQIVRSLVECGPTRDHEIVPLGRPILDLASDTDLIVAAIEAGRPDVIVSTAAYTAVDKAESERDLAFAVNESGAAAVARAARKLAVPLIHLSTDYVFDGSKALPYAEEDATGPKSVYGASKLAGEVAVLAEHADCAVLRTAWVYSPFGANFMKTMLRLAAERSELGVVGDQRGNPTSALDVADGILTVAENLAGSHEAAQRGIFHIAAEGEASWAEFAQAIFAASEMVGGPSAHVRPIASRDYPAAARRPANSRLDCSKLALTHGVRLPHWRTSLFNVVSRHLAANVTSNGNPDG